MPRGMSEMMSATGIRGIDDSQARLLSSVILPDENGVDARALVIRGVHNGMFG